jgi:S-methylmethionine-dependent homocysteine/selenocysteine methylase
LTAHGELIEQAAATICQKSSDQLLAIGVNCIHPANVVPLMQRLQYLNRDLIAYPNAGATWDAEKRFE